MDRRAELVERAERRIANHPAEYRDDLERYLFSFASLDELEANLDLRDDLDRAHWARESRYRTPPRDDFDAVPTEFVEVPSYPEYDHDREQDGIDSRMFGSEVDHPWREIA